MKIYSCPSLGSDYKIHLWEADVGEENEDTLRHMGKGCS